MSLSGKERRILAEIEQALEQDDPELAKRVAAINEIESDGVPARRKDDEVPRADELPRARDAIPIPGDEPAPRADPERPRGHSRGRQPGRLSGRQSGRQPGRVWLIVVVVVLTFLLLVLAVATA
ncbi:DUF3040 domain-containing protein [Nonomuraea sp. NPDC049714]|uniref:DUF3040 domain-containing protein n=1 Tax=Nonomuraea sp. NPDC049714 TaxID=3364357 RepID=UPI003789B3C3